MDIFKLLGTVAVENDQANKAIDETTDKAEQSEAKMSKAFGKIGESLVNAFEKDEPKKLNDSLADLTKTVIDQEDDLAKLNSKYKDLVSEQGEAAEETQKCAEEIENLSTELKENKSKLSDAEQAADKFDKTIEDVGDEAEKSEKKVSSFGEKLKTTLVVAGKAGAAAVAAIVAVGTAVIGLSESTREYRTEMGKLTTAFVAAGHSADVAYEAYAALQGVLGETDQAVEAANHLALLCDSEQELQKWTVICTGVYATFGASLPIEGLTEAANETAKVGQVTGPLADALNWAGVSEDAFNASLAACTTEQERQALITETLIGLYGEAAAQYSEANAQIIAANQAQEKMNNALGQMGAVAEPIVTAMKGMFADALVSLTPFVEQLGTGLLGVLTSLEPLFTQFTDQILPLLSETMDAIMPSLIEIVSVLIPVLFDLTSALLPIFTQIVSAVLPVVADLLSALLPPLMQIVDTVMPILTELLGILLPSLMQIVDMILPIMLSLLEAWLPIMEPILNLLVSLLQPILDLLLLILDPILQLVNVLLQPLIDGMAQAAAMLESTLAPALQVAGEWIAGLGDKIAVLKESVVAKFEEIKTNMTTKLNAAKNTVTNIFNAIKTAIQNPIETAKNIVQNAINAIKGFFNFSISWPHIPMPHFSISPSGWKIGDLLKGSIPSLGIEWYAKAMENPMLMENPTVFGMNPENGKLRVGGEAGSEVVSGTDKLMEMIGQAVESKMAVQQDRIIELLDALVDGNAEMLKALIAGHTIVLNKREVARTVREYA